MRLAALAIGLMASAAGAAPPVSFARDIVPVLKMRCATCHLTGKEAGNLALHPAAAFRSLVKAKSVEAALPRVAPGAPDRSYLMMKLDGTHLAGGGTGVRMPMGAAPLDAPTRDRFRAWIAAGAPNN